MTRRIPAALAAMGLLLAAAPALHAQALFALTCVGTDTDFTVHYEYRWGESGEWTSADASPGYWRAFTYTYDYPGENRSPTFQVRYDDDLGDRDHRVFTSLASYAAKRQDCEGEGRTYNFHNRGQELFIGEGE